MFGLISGKYWKENIQYRLSLKSFKNILLNLNYLSEEVLKDLPDIFNERFVTN